MFYNFWTEYHSIAHRGSSLLSAHLWPFLMPSRSSSSSSSSCSSEACWEPIVRARSSSSSSTVVSLRKGDREKKWQERKKVVLQLFWGNRRLEWGSTWHMKLEYWAAQTAYWDGCSHLCWIVSRVRSLSSISLELSHSVFSNRLQSNSAQAGISPTDLQTPAQKVITLQSATTFEFHLQGSSSQDYLFWWMKPSYSWWGSMAVTAEDISLWICITSWRRREEMSKYSWRISFLVQTLQREEQDNAKSLYCSLLSDVKEHFCRF